MVICEMKSYTNLEQSKKLAEILPVESADAFYDMAEPEKRQVPIIGHPDEYYDMEDWAIPSWSLAALLSVIPQEIFGGEYVINITEGCDNRWVLTYDCCENRNHSIYGLYSGADNLVDACYEMIYKLKKKDLL